MLTPEQIANLDAHAARATLDEICTEYYGTERWKSALAQDVGYVPRQVVMWMKDGEKAPPVWVILMMESRLQARKAKEALAMITTGLSMARDLV